MSCKMCYFFEKSKETKEKIEAVNNAILRDCKYKDVQALLIGFRNDNKLTIPSEHLVKKHKANCLTGVTPPPLEPVRHIGASVNIVEETNNDFEFNYEEFEKLSLKELRKDLKKDWIICARYFTEQIIYQIKNPNYKFSINSKDLVAIVKTLSDLHFFDNGKVDYEIGEEDKIKSINVSILPPADIDKIINNFTQTNSGNDKK